jgi:hypothetical protein
MTICMLYHVFLTRLAFALLRTMVVTTTTSRIPLVRIAVATILIIIFHRQERDVWEANRS